MSTVAYTAFQRRTAAEALDMHNDGCCTPGARCELGAALERVAAPGDLAPDISAAQPTPTRRTNTNGTSTGGTILLGASERQMQYLTALLEELKGIKGATAVTCDRIAAAIKHCADNGEPFPAKAASDFISHLIPLAKKARAARQNRPTAADLTPGMYEKDGALYKVKLSGAGRLYALVLVEVKDEDGALRGEFVYTPGAIRDLGPEHRIGAEVAGAHGRRLGFCICCGRLLTNAQSIEDGIGPICADRF